MHTKRTIAAGAAVLVGLGLVGVGAAPAHAATVSDTATLNAAILADAPVIELSNGFTLTDAIATIDHEAEIIGNGHTIDAGGWTAFRIEESVSVTGLTVRDAYSDAFKVYLPAGGTAEFTDVHVDRAGADGIDVEVGDGASVTVTRGSVTDAVDSGIELWDVSGSMTAVLSGVELSGNGLGVAMANALSGTSTLDVLGATIEDAEYGIQFTAHDESAVTVAGTTILAGPGNNAGGLGTGVHAVLEDDSRVALADSSVWGDPDADRFSDGVFLAQSERTTAVIEDSLLAGNEVNVAVYAGAPETSFSLLRTRVESSNSVGVCLGAIGGTALIDESTLAGNGRLGYPSLCADVFSGTGGGLTVSRSTISGGAWGAADVEIGNDGTIVRFVNSTFSGNNGSDEGGDTAAISVHGDGGTGRFELLHSTITGNTDVFAGLFVDGISALVANSIVSGDRLLADGAEVLTGDDADVLVEWSVIGSIAGSGAHTAGAGVKTAADPGVGPLQDNGGPTLTHALLSGSVALDSGDPDVGDLPATDQRGQARIQGGRIDIGAVEMDAALPATGAEGMPWLVAALAMLVAGAGVVVARRFVLH